MNAELSATVQPDSFVRRSGVGNGWAWLALLAVFCLAGCTRTVVDGDTETVRFEYWVSLSVMLAGIVGVVGGWFLMQVSMRIGIVGMILGGLAILLLGPGLMLDYARATPQEFEMRTGFWFSPTHVKVRFQDMSNVTLTKKVTGGRRRSTSYTLECQLKTGDTVRVPVSDLMKNGGLEIFVERCAENQIPIVDLT
jgi:hypothetical protein